MSEPRTRIAAIHLRGRDRAALDAIRVAGGFTSDQAALRTALWNLGKHLHVEMDAQAFALSAHPRKRRLGGCRNPTSPPSSSPSS